jgi:predicted histidine transporter YuiF (NhaC family)
MTEIPANVTFLMTPELTEFMIWAICAIVTGLTTGIIFLYKDNRKERREYMDKLLTVVAGNTEAFNQLKLTNQRLCDIVDRTERTSQNLERLILEKLER